MTNGIDQKYVCATCDNEAERFSCCCAECEARERRRNEMTIYSKSNGYAGDMDDWRIIDEETHESVAEFKLPHDEEGEPIYSDLTNEGQAKMTLSNAQLRQLGRICTHNEAGLHFAEWVRHWEEFENLGLIEIYRPVHAETGIPYDQTSWQVEITEDGLATLGIKDGEPILIQHCED